MQRVIPAILEQSVSDIQEKLDRVAAFVELIQLDIADGLFVPEEVMNDPGVLDLIQTTAAIDLHLMIELHEVVIEKWLHPVVRRISIHIEASEDSNASIEKIKEADKEVFLAINPETPIKKLEPYAEIIDGVLIMGVHPGYGGQEFIPSTLEKVKDARILLPERTIAVDGGVKEGIAIKLFEAGADQVAMGTGLFSATNLEKYIKKINSFKDK